MLRVPQPWPQINRDPSIRCSWARTQEGAELMAQALAPQQR